jgi:hypothetical protein
LTSHQLSTNLVELQSSCAAIADPPHGSTTILVGALSRVSSESSDRHAMLQL